jgi:hypothetical protein
MSLAARLLESLGHSPFELCYRVAIDCANRVTLDKAVALAPKKAGSVSSVTPLVMNMAQGLLTFLLGFSSCGGPQ